MFIRDWVNTALESVSQATQVDTPSEEPFILGSGLRCGASSDNATENEFFELLSQETGYWEGSSVLSPKLADLFSRMPDESVPRCRAILDSGMIFRQDSSLCDLRTMVFDVDRPVQQKQAILSKFRATCFAPPRKQEGFVVLWDVDDTLIPGADMLGIAGTDRSWHLDGRLYPGVSRLQRELCCNLRAKCGGDYPVLLSARPPIFCFALNGKFKRLSGVANPKMAIMPGAGGGQVIANAFRVLMSEFTTLGQTKFQRMKEYAQLFPDFAGRFVFIGDDGQGDLIAAEQMLELQIKDVLPYGCSAESGGGLAGILPPSAPLIAFAAIKSCHKDHQSGVVGAARQKIVRRIREKNPFAPEDVAVGVPGDGGFEARHRFFYFDEYSDLADQLADAEWIRVDQAAAVRRAWFRDLVVPAPLELAKSCNYVGLRSAIEVFNSLNIDECDEEESANCTKAKELLDRVSAVHAFIGAPPPDATVLRLRIDHVTISTKSWPVQKRVQDDLVQWDEDEQNDDDEANLVRFTLLDAGATSTKAAHVDLPASGVTGVRWPCKVLTRVNARAALNISLGNHVGQCFLVFEDPPDGIPASSGTEFNNEAPNLACAAADPTTAVDNVSSLLTPPPPICVTSETVPSSSDFPVLTTTSTGNDPTKPKIHNPHLVALSACGPDINWFVGRAQISVHWDVRKRRKKQTE